MNNKQTTFHIWFSPNVDPKYEGYMIYEVGSMSESYIGHISWVIMELKGQCEDREKDGWTVDVMFTVPEGLEGQELEPELKRKVADELGLSGKI